MSVRRVLLLPVACSLLLAGLPVQGLGAAPLARDLGAAAQSLAISGNGGLVVVGTAAGVFGFAPDGTQRFHVLDNFDVRAVAADQAGDVIVAGDSMGLVHFLRADGTETALAPTTGTVSSVDISADGTAVVVGGEDNFVWFFQPAKQLPPPLPALPGLPVALPERIILYQWAYQTEAPILAVHVTPDGEWINAASQVVWGWNKDGALLPFLNLPRFPCQFSSLGPKCWFVEEFAAGGVASFLVGSRSTYDILVGFTNLVVQNEKATLTTGTWEFFPGALPTTGAFSGDGSRQLEGESLGRFAYYDNTPVPCCGKQAVWSANLGGRVTHAALDQTGALAAGATSSAVTLFSGAGAQQWSYSTSGTVTGLAFTPSGSALVATAGNQALFWT